MEGGFFSSPSSPSPGSFLPSSFVFCEKGGTISVFIPQFFCFGVAERHSSSWNRFFGAKKKEKRYVF